MWNDNAVEFAQRNLLTSRCQDAFSLRNQKDRASAGAPARASRNDRAQDGDAIRHTFVHQRLAAQIRRWAKRLLKDKVQALIGEVRQQCAGKPQSAAVEQALGYFVRNVSRMQYGTFRAAGYFIGSGVVEAGCKTVIGGRCKQSGMFWSESGAENILALRCIHSSRRLEDFWKYRLNEQAAHNDALPLAA